MPPPTHIPSPQRTARLAGLCYLLTIAIGAFDHLAVGRSVASADAAETAHNLLAVEPIYRIAFALDLLPVYVAVTVLLYQLLKPVSATVSLLAAATSLVGGAVGSCIAVLQIAPLIVLHARPLEAFSAPQRDGLAMLLLDLHGAGFTISLVFFGFYCLLLGGLISASRFIPRLVGLLLGLAGAAYVGYALADLVVPALAAGFAVPTLMLGSLGEAVLTLWLLVFGVNVGAWRERAAMQTLALA